MGDFNTPLLASDKLGGFPPDVKSRQHLAGMIRDLALLDVDLGGCKFTWSNRRIGQACIQVRLDRALISLDWLGNLHYNLSSLVRLGSDHSPISLTLDKINRKKSFPFGFEKMWLPHLGLHNKIKDWWDIEVDGTVMYNVAKKLRYI